ncbi:MAG: ABC transporter ATP-binding protein [Candidatus Bipolaricaulota bacterium]
MRGIGRELWRYRLWLLCGGLALLVVDAAQLVSPLIIGRAVDDLARGVGDHLIRYALYLGGLALIATGFRFVWRLFLFGAGRRIERDLRNRLYSHLERLSPSYYAEHTTGDLMAHATNDLEAVRQACALGVLLAADTVMMLAFTLAVMMAISPRLTLYAFIPMPIITLVVLGFGRVIHRRFRRVQEAFATLTERTREALSGVRLLRAFAREPGMNAAYADVNQDNLEANLRLVRLWGVFRPLIQVLSGAGMVLLLWFGGRSVLDGTISLGSMVAFVSYLTMLVWPMMALGWIVNILQRGSASMNRLDKIFAEEPDIVSPQRPTGLPRVKDLEFRRLSFAYPDDLATSALEDVNVKVPEGSTLGVIGLTGSGKSTLVKLIPRLYDPPPGSVLLGGTDVRHLKLSDLRSTVGVVPQDVFLFSTSVRENIAYGQPEASDEDVLWAARMAGLEEEIDVFPEGLDTVVGERGLSVSGGQRQRIGLARSLLLNTPIIVLDDVLSSVDAKVEEEILGNLRSVLQRRTAIVVAHRISAVRNADWIVVLDGGQVVEEGDHNHLVSQGGLYARLNEYQQVLQE